MARGQDATGHFFISMTLAEGEGPMTEANTNGLELSKLRGELAAIDRVLVDALGRRYLLAREVRRLKREAGVEILDPAPEAEVLRMAAELARETGIDEEDRKSVG